MDYIYTTVVISNPGKPWLKSVSIKCLVDGSSLMLSITQKIATQLQLSIVENRIVFLDDGTKINVPYVGPIKIEFNNRSFFACAFVLGDQPMLGAVRMSEIDFIIHKNQQPFHVSSYTRSSLR